MAQKYQLHRLRGIIDDLGQATLDLTAPAYDSKWIAKVKDNLEYLTEELERVLDDLVEPGRAEKEALAEMETLPLIEECEHDKVYAGYMLASDPPQTPWICRKCHKQGRDVRLGPIQISTEYADLLHTIINKTIKVEKK